jgi:hypothetical protein
MSELTIRNKDQIIEELVLTTLIDWYKTELDLNSYEYDYGYEEKVAEALKIVILQCVPYKDTSLWLEMLEELESEMLDRLELEKLKGLEDGKTTA